MFIHLLVAWIFSIALVRCTDLPGLDALVRRRLPSHSHSFTFNQIDGEGDAFNVTDTSILGGITVSCTTTSACARGLYTYLTQRAGVDIWWTGSRLNNLPPFLPRVHRPLSGKAVVPYRYHFDAVTFGYTTAFWSFDKWELLLDWLALRGVNIPLAELGTRGPLPAKWVNDQFELQKQIVRRMAELGMTPVLPAFTGFVPKALKTRHFNATINPASPWITFPPDTTPVDFLQPTDPLFATLQKSFILKQKEAYGNVSHIYTLDQYNENNPTSGDLTYLHNVAADTFASLRAADPQAIWLMSGWLFFSSSYFWSPERVQAYLGGVPGPDSMIILDFYSEIKPQWDHLQNFFGKSWVWCELHDFGGDMGMQGNLQLLTTKPLEALNSSGSSMKGMGLTMEGQEGNEIVYDVLLDQAWSSTPLNVSGYGRNWTMRRYQSSDLPDSVYNAWSTLDGVIYNIQNPGTQSAIKSIFELAPSLSGLVGRIGHHPTFIPYDTNTTIVPSLRLLVQAGSEHRYLRDNPEFNYDIVDICRQLLANRFIDVYNNLVSTYSSSSADAVAAAALPLLDIIRDLDWVLGTNENFLLANWIRDARSWAGDNETYAAYLEYNARNQITLWGSNGEENDYASKQWAGLVGDYYLRRWQSFTDYLVATKRNGVPYNADYVKSSMISIGKEWNLETFTGPWDVQGNTFDTVQNLLLKYA
ncbi:hypothetical protein NLI96_g7362 [Meripilus lineatus]|uniref:Alpha-N-acetylglucosaminidase n=1 Tax=Meripilus lineatus TaxID=2056292 RepID=A0AAD5UZM0_9APHY|nr:hypothetical protein NLI96_g7362 [Physisporinus lineatus]